MTPEGLPRGSGLLATVPAHQRRQILAGMRWTVWLAALSLPVSYGATALLARAGPEVIGTYGVLGVYVGVVTGILFLGGETVLLKFIPVFRPADRPMFLATYSVIASLMLLPLLALAAIYRQYLHYLFGKGASPDFYFGILCFSPVYILFSMTTATLKGMLEIRWAQGLLRLVTFGSFGVYAALFVMARGFLVRRPAVAIWGTYLGLAAVGTLIGIHRILRLSGWHGIPRQWRPMLPGGFWRFLLATQQVGWVQMLGGRLDYVLILNYGGLAVLGKYVAVTAVATTVPTILRFFLDTLFPSLTNLVADRNLAGAQSVLTMQIRIVLAVCTAATCGLVLLASLFLEVLGPQYADLRGPVILMTWLLGLSSPLVFGGAVLAAFGKMQRVVWVGLIQVGVFAALFWALWTRWQLTAAVAANGIAVVISNLILFGLANRYLPVGRAEIKSYVQFAVVATVTAATVSYFAQVSTVAAIAIWLGTIGLFLLVGGYSVEECRELVRFYTPGRGGVPEKPALEQSEGKALVV